MLIQGLAGVLTHFVAEVVGEGAIGGFGNRSQRRSDVCSPSDAEPSARALTEQDHTVGIDIRVGTDEAVGGFRVETTPSRIGDPDDRP